MTTQNPKIAERIEHIFKFMEYDNITDSEHDWVVRLEEWWEDEGYLTKKQVKILEDIFKRGNER
jgi:hypothetical protein